MQKGGPYESGSSYAGEHAGVGGHLERKEFCGRGSLTPVGLVLSSMGFSAHVAMSMSRFWVEKGARKRRESMSCFLRNRVFSPGP